MEDFFNYKEKAKENYKIKFWNKEDCVNYILQSDYYFSLKSLIKEKKFDLKNKVNVKSVLNNMDINSLKSMVISLNQRK